MTILEFINQNPCTVVLICICAIIFALIAGAIIEAWIIQIGRIIKRKQ